MATGVQLVVKYAFPFKTLPICAPQKTTPRGRYDRDIEFLRDSRVSSGYACVYTSARDRFRARVLKGIHIDSCKTAEEAARSVVEWYKWWYGDGDIGSCPKWLMAFYARKVNPWRTRRVKRGGCYGYVVDVFYHNTPIRVTRRTWRFPNEKTPKWYKRMTPKEREIADWDVWTTRKEAIDQAKKVIYQRIRHELGFLGVNVLQLFWRGKDRRRQYQAPLSSATIR